MNRDNSIQVNKNATTFLASSESYTGKRISRRRKSKSLLKMDQECELNQPEEEDRRIQEDSRSEIVVARDRNHWCVNNNKESADVVGNSPNVRYRKLSSTSTYHYDFCTSTASTENDQLNNQRIAEFFADEKNQYAKLIKQGQPNVYLLNAKETSVSGDLRWFDIGHLNGSSPFGFRNHKVIILMGATGCGKSTLINGMVNYILGVRWNDPFRFKCVREDETTARNQAISQTSSVTAYTLRHHKGMAVPYSITIIDTPGYGDTRGVQRDKEITHNIHQFLTQQETRVDEIHAACFVAASGDSRLTTTQRYIIDSTLSIFGKDIKENIRLLVTFADNADPPVVDACRAANFPVTSASAGISYSKFNSSVLYANNEQQEDDGSCFDELFWDMGQENFSKFFTMLEGMNGRSLKSTREVIQRRNLLEKSLEDIEQELEVCLFNIENMETFQRKMKQCGQKMEASKNFVIENMKLNYNRFPCKKEFYAYNCRECKKTCEQPIRSENPDKLEKNKKMGYHLACPHLASDHDYENFEIRQTTKIIKNTLLDLKEKYQSNADEKVANEQLLAGCSDQLNLAKAKVFSLLDRVGENVRSLESTALRSNTLSPSDYLCLMKSRVAEKQAPGYLIRLETLSELQKSLEDSAVAKTQQATACYHSNRQTFQHEFQSTGGSRGHGSNNAGGNPWRTHNGMEDYSIDFTRRNPTHGSKHNHFTNKPHWRN